MNKWMIFKVAYIWTVGLCFVDAIVCCRLNGGKVRCCYRFVINMIMVKVYLAFPLKFVIRLPFKKFTSDKLRARTKSVAVCSFHFFLLFFKLKQTVIIILYCIRCPPKLTIPSVGRRRHYVVYEPWSASPLNGEKLKIKLYLMGWAKKKKVMFMKRKLTRLETDPELLILYII